MAAYKKKPVLNMYLMKPGEIVKLVQEELGNRKVIRNGVEKDKLNLSVHTRCWRRYEVRPPGGRPNPGATNSKYCIYDELHNDYGYTREWGDFLVSKLNNESEFNRIYDLNHPVQNHLETLDSVEEVHIIRKALKK